MQAMDAFGRFSRLDPIPMADYNYEHFWAKHLLEDVQRTMARAGIQPGEMAPDFELPQASGGSLRLSDLRGRPVVMHFGSFT